MSKRTYNSSLSSWLIKRPKEGNDTPLASSSTTINCNKVPPISINKNTLDILDVKQTLNFENEKIYSPSTINNLNEFTTDIGYFVKSSLSNSLNITDNHKVQLLKLSNIPKDNFIYPFSIHLKKNKEEKRFLNRSHFEKYKWLVYSDLKNGVLCKFCVLFSNNTGGKDRVTPLNKLVKEPLQKYAKILGKDGDFEVHSKNQYHIASVQKAENFLLMYKNPHKEVINVINTERMKQILENRKRLKPIIETIVFLGRQNIPLRGHSDSGNFYQKVNSVLPTSYADSIVNKGNFRELLKLRISCGDSDLENHLKSTHSKATYISPTIQNDIIECCKNYITGEILKEIQVSKYYSIIFDETTDISNISQMSLVIRYIYAGKIKESFMGFINCHDVYNETETDSVDFIKSAETDKDTYEPKLTGEILGQVVVNMLKKLSLNFKNCVGIGTDGCSVMVSTTKGAVKKVQEYAPNALHCPCSNHALNLSISKSSTVQVIRNCVGIIMDVISFFSMSSKRNFVLKKILNGKPHLQSLCETRWVERHDSIMIFKSSLSDIIEALSLISDWQDQVSSSKAKSLLLTLCTCEFINALMCLSNVLCVTSKVSKLLQAKWQDVCQTNEIIDDVISNLEEKRKNVTKNFHALYTATKNIMSNLEIEEKFPRLTVRQTKRPNYLASSVEEYYRVSVYIPLLENVLSDMKQRFCGEKNQVFFILSQLVPRCIIGTNNEDITKLIQTIRTYFAFGDTDFVDLEEMQLQTEIDLWKSKWIKVKNQGGKVDIDAITSAELCNDILYPTIKKLLYIISCLPVSVASTERSFSTLRRLKTWLRSKMGQDRLSGLALLHVRRQIDIPTDKIIEKFSKMKKRTLEFSI